MKNGYLDIPIECEAYTGIGRLFERFQIVELPQLVNIVIHGLSFVGNRPLPQYNCELLKKFEGWDERFDCPAGITGISQVVGKLNQRPEERLELERLYARVYKEGNILKCDLMIVFYTIRLLSMGKPVPFEKAKRMLLDMLQ